MTEIRETAEFIRWFAELRDQTAGARILVRIRRLSLGNPGDVRPVGGGVAELRFSWGPGYRIYFVARGEKSIVLLRGGTKRSQEEDIRRAVALAQRLKER